MPDPLSQTSEIAEKLKEGNYGLLLDLVAKEDLTPSDCRAVLAECAGTPGGLRANCAKSFELLIDRSACELHSADENGDSLAHLAARHDNLMLLALLPAEIKFQTNNKGLTPFMEAAQSGKTRCAKHLMHLFRQTHLASNWQAVLCKNNSEGRTALDMAEECGWHELAKIIEAELKLLENGLTPQQERIRIQLEQLALAGNLAELKLLATSANCDLPDGAGKTALMRVSECKSAGLEVLKLLAGLGDPTAPDANGWSSLHSAAAAGWEGAMWALANSGAAVNCGDHRNWTALMQAASRDHVDSVRALLRLGANWEMRDNNGSTALYYADRNCCKQTSELLGQFADKSFFKEKLRVHPLLASADSATLPTMRSFNNRPTLPVRAPGNSGIKQQEGSRLDLNSKLDALNAAAAMQAKETPVAAGEVAMETEAAKPTESSTVPKVECKSVMKSIKFGEEIGRGAFGTVCRATLPNSPTEYCAKFINLPFHDTDGKDVRNHKVADNIKAELNLCGLKHENIAKFVEICYNADSLQITVVMERVYGKTLNNFLNGEPVQIEVNRKLTTQICSALQYMHSMGVVHRDINGNNILIDRNKLVKLIDFGLSRRLCESDTHCLESSTMPKGTLHFLAPERFGGDDQEGGSSGRICPKTDIWALGCIVYYMANGRVPYDNIKSFVHLGSKISTFGAPSLASSPETCDIKMIDFYGCCTDKNYKTRKSSAELLKHPFIVCNSDHLAVKSQNSNDDDNEKGSGPDGGDCKRRPNAGHGDGTNDPRGADSNNGGGPGGPSGSSEGSILNNPGAVASQRTAEDDDRYPVTSPRRGVCLIINVEKYDRRSLLEDREGSRLDVDRLSTLFSKMAFDVQLAQNPTSQEMPEQVHAASVEFGRSNLGCFVCVIMAHGSSGEVYGSDGESVGLESIMRPLYPVHCTSLLNKPKIFIIQACRGLKADESRFSPNRAEDSRFSPYKKDFLVCHSSTKGETAHRDRYNGSLFVQTFCDVICDRFRHDHLTDIMANVNCRLMKAQSSARHGFDDIVVSEYCSTLTKKCYLDIVTDVRVNTEEDM
ncbi:hypothetical protein BOX15_Mlig018903g3 [Macrostomum lignano]|uniref:Protein kinase domain-containing protein n=1 Tax=Macrostomum lignano TaxID=282301 RepID=A0A267DEP6_9PLAT|nr:hypothetical protein BOX15_Mlig018903g3 [Macrostomum lignano]